MIEETTLPEAPALIVPPGYDPQPRRWRAIWTRGYRCASLLYARALVPVEERGEGASAYAALDALLLPLCTRGELESGAQLLVQIIELGDDEIPDFWTIRIERAANGAWGWTVQEVV